MGLDKIVKKTLNNIMPEPKSEHHSHSHHHFHLGLFILFILVLLVGIKLLSSKAKWNSYVVQSQNQVRQYKVLDSIEDGQIIAMTIVSVPANNPLLKQPAQLEAYIQSLSGQTGRDIVIIDTSKKILADTIAANVGSTYTYDTNGEIKNAFDTGLPQTFNEKSVDYPNGIEQTVIPFKDIKGSVTGAIIISNSRIFGN